MKKNIFITNFTQFSYFNNNNNEKIKIITNAEGEELGFEVCGLLTTFDVKNENGFTFTKRSYDSFVDDYFIKNSLNVPLCLLHNDEDIRNVCGYIKEMTKRDDGVYIVGFIPRYAYYYNLIKQYINNGILQGFSNAGGVMEAQYDRESDNLIIEGFALRHAALVAVPADTGAKFVNNTVFNGFDNADKKMEEITADDLMIM